METWKENFKLKIKKRIRSFKHEQMDRVKEAEESQWKQKISEFELNQRVT